MISADEFVLEQSYKEDDHRYLFENETYMMIQDNQNGVYPSPQISFEANMLQQNGKFQSWSQSFVSIPIVMSLALTGTGALVNDVRNAFAMSLKSGYWNIINSMQITIDGNDVTNYSNLANMKINYDILSSWSNDYATTN